MNILISREEFLQSDLFKIIKKCDWDKSKNKVIDDIVKNIQNNMGEIPSNQYSVEVVGSHGKGTQIFSSDVDIAILFENSVNMTKEACFDYVKKRIEKDSIMQIFNEKSSAIGCKLDEVSVDIVPAKRHNDGTVHLYVTDEGERSKMTDFNEHVQRAANSEYIDLIKLIKIWAGVFDVKKKIKSFLLETFVLDLEEDNLLYGDLYDQFFYVVCLLGSLEKISINDCVNSRSLKGKLTKDDYEYIKKIVTDTLLNYVPYWCELQDKSPLSFNENTYVYKVFNSASQSKDVIARLDKHYVTATNTGQEARGQGKLRGKHNKANRGVRENIIKERVEFRGFHFLDFEEETLLGIKRSSRIVIHKK